MEYLSPINALFIPVCIAGVFLPPQNVPWSPLPLHFGFVSQSGDSSET